MAEILTLCNIEYCREYRFHPHRSWRFDFVVINFKIAIEAEGGTWMGKKGGHTSGVGYAANCEKYNEALKLGWHVLRYTTDMIRRNPRGIVDDIRYLQDDYKYDLFVKKR